MLAKQAVVCARVNRPDLHIGPPRVDCVLGHLPRGADRCRATLQVVVTQAGRLRHLSPAGKCQPRRRTVVSRRSREIAQSRSGSPVPGGEASSLRTRRAPGTRRMPGSTHCNATQRTPGMPQRHRLSTFRAAAPGETTSELLALLFGQHRVDSLASVGHGIEHLPITPFECGRPKRSATQNKDYAATLMGGLRSRRRLGEGRREQPGTLA